MNIFIANVKVNQTMPTCKTALEDLKRKEICLKSPE